MDFQILIYPGLIFILFVLALQVYGKVEIKKKQVDAERDINKARVYSDGKSFQTKLEGLTDIRLASFQNPGEEQTELQQAMSMLGMLKPQESLESSINQTSGVEQDLQEFAKTSDGLEAMKKFQVWKSNR